MKHIFIVNSYGKKDPREIRDRIYFYCLNKGLDFEIVNNKEMNTEKIVSKYAREGNVIYAVGGDGMINRVLNGVVNTDAMLGYIPYGTGNDLDRVISNYEDGIHDINVGKINDKYFINVACFGVDADISNDERFIHNEIIPEKMRYNVGAVYHFLTYKPKSLSIEFREKYDGMYFHFRETKLFSTIAVCNGQYYGGGYNIAPNAQLDDNVFDVYLVDKMNRLKLASTILKMKNGKHENVDGVHKHFLSEITIRSNDAIKANIDGEVLESDEFNISLENNIKVYNNQDIIKKVLKK